MWREWRRVSSVCKDQQRYNFNAAPFLLPPYRVCLYIKKYTQLTIQNVYIYSIHTISYDYTSTVCLFLLHWKAYGCRNEAMLHVCVVLSVFWAQEVHVSCLTATVNVHWGCIESADHQEGPHHNPLILTHSERQVKRATPTVEVTTFTITSAHVRVRLLRPQAPFCTK